MHETNETPFQVHYSADGACEDGRLLARIRFADYAPDTVSDSGDIVVPLTPIGSRQTIEVWRSSLPVEFGIEGDIAYRRNAEVLVGHLVLDESHGGLEAAARRAYVDIGALLAEQGYRHALRIWNYFPHINETKPSEERYKSFCSGRQQALDMQGQGLHSLPAACAIGSSHPGLRIYFLAAKTPGVQIENPRQISAFHYPKQYGRRSPAFSRAVVKDWAGDPHLYVSGTASITGHRSRHDGVIGAQLDETIKNLQALMVAGGQHVKRRFSLADNALLKIYVRNPRDADEISQRLKGAVGDRAGMLFLHGDICRQELLLEIEALCGPCDS